MFGLLRWSVAGLTLAGSTLLFFFTCSISRSHCATRANRASFRAAAVALSRMTRQIEGLFVHASMSKFASIAAWPTDGVAMSTAATTVAALCMVFNTRGHRWCDKQTVGAVSARAETSSVGIASVICRDLCTGNRRITSSTKTRGTQHTVAIQWLYRRNRKKKIITHASSTTCLQPLTAEFITQSRTLARPHDQLAPL